MSFKDWYDQTFSNPMATVERMHNWTDSKATSFNNFVNYEGEGYQSWFLNKGTRIGSSNGNIGNFSMDGVEDVAFALKDPGRGASALKRVAKSGLSESGFYSYMAQPGSTVGSAAAKGLGGTALRGFASAFVPMEPFGEKQLSTIAQHTSFSGEPGKLANLAKHGLVRTGLKWLGPVVTGYRLGTETTGKGFFGGAEQGVRIIGEEGFRTAGMTVGAVLGTAVGGPVGTVAGMAAGYALGEIGAYGWNTAVSTALLPGKVAAGSWNYIADLGRQGSRANLGGQVSIGNASGIGYTMRQRALSQMNRSGINARSLLGQEASYMHIR